MLTEADVDMDEKLALETRAWVLLTLSEDCRACSSARSCACAWTNLSTMGPASGVFCMLCPRPLLSLEELLLRAIFRLREDLKLEIEFVGDDDSGVDNGAVEEVEELSSTDDGIDIEEAVAVLKLVCEVRSKNGIALRFLLNNNVHNERGSAK